MHVIPEFFKKLRIKYTEEDYNIHAGTTWKTTKCRISIESNAPERISNQKYRELAETIKILERIRRTHKETRRKRKKSAVSYMLKGRHDGNTGTIAKSRKSI